MNTHLPLPLNRLQKTFLHMDLPIFEYSWDTNTLSPGLTHRLPFKFIVPEELPIHACRHACANHQVQQEHLQLPASLSYRGQKSHGTHDMSPKMAEVIYSINFSLWQRGDKAGKSKKIQESRHPVQIIPTRDEHAPILVPSENKYYQLCSERILSKGMLRHTLGKFTACSTQAPAIQVQSQRPKNPDASTTVKIDLRFEPTHPNQLPPMLLPPGFQLRAMTFFGLDPWTESPDLSDISKWGIRQGFWSENVSLMSSVTTIGDWKLQAERDRMVFTASVETSISLPEHRHYPPTFHSCLVSRAYALKAKLFYRVHGKSWGSFCTSLSLPVEIYTA